MKFLVNYMENTQIAQEWKSLCKLHGSENTVFRRFKEYQHRMQNSFRFSAFRKPHQNNKETKKANPPVVWSLPVPDYSFHLETPWTVTWNEMMAWERVLGGIVLTWETQASLRSVFCVLGVWLHMPKEQGAIVLTAGREG